MSPFNIFRAISRSSRNNNPGHHARNHHNRRSKIVKRRRGQAPLEQEYPPQEVAPWSAKFTSVEESQDLGYYGPGYRDDADIYYPQTAPSHARPPSPIPIVYRQDSHGCLREIFSEQDDPEDLVLSNHQRTFGGTRSWGGVERARWQSPVEVNRSSVGSSERIRGGHYQEAEEPQYSRGHHSFQYDLQRNTSHKISSADLGHQGQLPTFVRVGDDNRVVIHQYDGLRNVWNERSHPHSSESTQTYYIVPPGVSVIFEDEDGNEITRVGDFNSGTRHSLRRPDPFILQDEDGRELYRSEGSSVTSYNSGLSDTPHCSCGHRMYHNSHTHHEAHSVPLLDLYGDERNIRHLPGGLSSSFRSTYNFILIDDRGRQIPIAYAADNPAGTSPRGEAGRSERGRPRYDLP